MFYNVFCIHVAVLKFLFVLGFGFQFMQMNAWGGFPCGVSRAPGETEKVPICSIRCS